MHSCKFLSFESDAHEAIICGRKRTVGDRRKGGKFGKRTVEMAARPVPAVPLRLRMFRTVEKGSYRFNSPGKAMGESPATRTLRDLSFVRAALGMKFFRSVIFEYLDNVIFYYLYEGRERESKK